MKLVEQWRTEGEAILVSKDLEKKEALATQEKNERRRLKLLRKGAERYFKQVSGKCVVPSRWHIAGGNPNTVSVRIDGWRFKVILEAKPSSINADGFFYQGVRGVVWAPGCNEGKEFYDHCSFVVAVAKAGQCCEPS